MWTTAQVTVPLAFLLLSLPLAEERASVPACGEDQRASAPTPPLSRVRGQLDKRYHPLLCCLVGCSERCTVCLLVRVSAAQEGAERMPIFNNRQSFL